MKKLFNRNLQYFPEASISEMDGIRALHLDSDVMQSAMNIKNPPQLVLSYCVAMVSWLLFAKNVRHITHIGLGGGSIVRWIANFFPEIKQLAVEINPQVISIARTMFELPFEDNDGFFHIEQADGIEFVRMLNNSTDVILVDCFDGIQIIEEMLEQPFLNDCYNALTNYGMLVCNLWSKDKRYQKFVSQIENVFNNRVLEIPATTHGNVAVLAFKRQPENITEQNLYKTAQVLSQKTDTDFFANYNAIIADNKKRKLW